MFDRATFDLHLKTLLEAEDAQDTFHSAQVIGELGTDSLPLLYAALRRDAPARGEAAYWGLSSAIYDVLVRHLDRVRRRCARHDESLINDAVSELGFALIHIAADADGAAVKLGTVLGDEIPEIVQECLGGESFLAFNVRLWTRSRAVLEQALAMPSIAAMIGATVGLSRLASRVGAELVRPALSAARGRTLVPAVLEVIDWALANFPDGEAQPVEAFS